MKKKIGDLLIIIQAIVTIPNFFARITCCASMPHFDAMAFTTAKISLTNRTVSVNIISVIFFTIIFPNYKSLSMRSCFIRFWFLFTFFQINIWMLHIILYIITKCSWIERNFFLDVFIDYCNRSTKKLFFRFGNNRFSSKRLGFIDSAMDIIETIKH